MIIDFRKIKNGVTDKVLFDFNESLLDFEHYGEKIFQSPINICGDITNKIGIINLYAKVSTKTDASCSRCLKPISQDFSFTLDQNLYLEKLEDDLDDTFVVTSSELNLSDIILPEVMLSVPMNFLCNEDCKGLCSKCGADLNASDCSCDTRIIDPRLAVLQKLLDK